jgi:hypothetical protein
MRSVLRRLSFFFLLVLLTRGAAQSQEVTPETSPTVTVTAKVSPPHHDHDPYTYSFSDPLLNRTMSLAGTLYHNDFFGLSYRLPGGWTAEETQITLKRNRGVTVRAEPPGSSLTAETVKILGPIILLNATPSDLANRVRLAPPFLTISVYLSGSEAFSVENVRNTLKSGESVREAHGIHLLAGPVEATIGSRVFVRTDFSEINDGPENWKTFFRTSVRGGQLVVNFCAGSKVELDQLLETVSSMAFDAPQTPSVEPGPPKP